MPTAWRQGNLLAPVDAVTLGVIKGEQCSTHRALVISHSCDIANTADIEPVVELLIGVVVRDDEATAQNGHSIRKLHLETEGRLTTEWVEYGISDRCEVSKAVLLQYEPWIEQSYSSEQRALLRRWLAQRYSRCEFPDAFISWLKESGVGNRFEDVGKIYSPHLVGIYFDFDDDSERKNTEDPYTLGINLVYEAGSAKHADEAEKAKVRLEALFEKRCKPNGEWRWIELTYCDVLSEEVFNLRAARMFRRWRFEHRSLGGAPIDSSE